MFSKKAIRIICIIMAVLMALSACAALVSVFAVDEGYYETYVNPSTGDNDGDYLIPAGIAVAALLVVGICVVLPKIRKKDEDIGIEEPDDEEDEDEDDDEDDSEDDYDEDVEMSGNNRKPKIIRADKK